MAITDNLVSHIYAEAGDATLTDKIQSLTMSGSGTASIVDVGGEAAWNLSSAAYTITAPDKAMNFATDGVENQGITIAMRYRINTFGSTGGYNRIMGGLLSDDTTKFCQLSKEGANVAGYWTTGRPIANLGAQTTATIHTLVLMAKSNTAGGWQDHLKAWRNTVGRVGTDADYSGVTTGALMTFGGLFVNAPDTMNYDLFDLVYWDRELTDAEAAAVADGLRTELPVGGGSGTTVNATLASVGVMPYQASIISNSPTIVNATIGTIGVSAFDAMIVTEASITTDVLKNNTGTVLASTSGIIASVYDLSTGALVVRKTGLTSDGSGVVTFSDVSLSNGTEYLVTITIATADGVARITAG